MWTFSRCGCELNMLSRSRDRILFFFALDASGAPRSSRAMVRKPAPNVAKNDNYKESQHQQQHFNLNHIFYFYCLASRRSGSTPRSRESPVRRSSIGQNNQVSSQTRTCDGEAAMMMQTLLMMTMMPRWRWPCHGEDGAAITMKELP